MRVVEQVIDRRVRQSRRLVDQGMKRQIAPEDDRAAGQRRQGNPPIGELRTVEKEIGPQERRGVGLGAGQPTAVIAEKCGA